MIDAGVALVVGSVSAEGEPRVHRACAAWIVEDESNRLRFVVSGDDPELVEHLGSGAVSLTSADVVTYRSAQFKGRPVIVEPPTSEDTELAAQHSEAFFEAINRTDGNPLHLLRRMLPHRMLSVEMIVDETFDQTPGPKAGAALHDGETVGEHRAAAPPNVTATSS
jgi:hypothetical protein